MRHWLCRVHIKRIYKSAAQYCNLKFKLFWDYLTKRRNILSNITNQYISTCVYDNVLDPYCPVFKIGQLVTDSESDPEERSQMYSKVIICVFCIVQFNYTIYKINFVDIFSDLRTDSNSSDFFHACTSIISGVYAWKKYIIFESVR